MGNKYTKDTNTVAVIVESVSGTYELPVAVLPLQRGNAIWNPTYDTDENDPLSKFQGSKTTTVITDFSAIEVSAEMKMPSDHTQIAVPLAGCGIAPTVEVGYVSYLYDSTKDTTLSMQQVGYRKKTSAYGARADLTITAEVGQAAMIMFDFKSTLNEVVQLGSVEADNVIPDSPALESVFMTKDCLAYTVNGNPAHFKKVELALGADVFTPKDTCSGASYTNDIKPQLKVTMSVTEDNEDAFNDLASGTEFNFVIPLFDNAGVKKWEIIVPSCVAIEQGTPEENGRLNVERTLECRKVLGDDNFELRAYTV